MFTVPILTLAALCSLFCTTDAVITGWTVPVIATKDGSAALVTKVAEDLVPGTTSILITATKDDLTGSIAYAITSQPASSKLTINSADGLLSLATGKSFDFETEPEYIFTVTATIAASVGTATVTLSITDANDAPVFASNQYVATIPDGSTAGTTLTTVMATDEDDEDTITYSIEAAGNVDSTFTIVGTSGLITVATGKTLAAATIGGYQLKVFAADNAGTPKSGTTTVWVAVKTCSSNSIMLISSMITLLVALVASLQ